MPAANKEALLELQFEVRKVDRRYSAECLICRQKLQNTAIERLKAHRRRCGSIAERSVADSLNTTASPPNSGSYVAEISEICFVDFSDIKVIDFRSDTQSMPTEGMRKAIYEAVVGDDLYAEDPTVNALEERCAKLAGKEAALYVPSGTMANLISILVHCNERSSEVIVGESSHINLFEQRGSIQFGGVSLREIRENEDGTFDLNELDFLIRKMDPLMEPTTKLVSVENTHMAFGGKVLPLEWIDELIEFTKSKNLKTHLDGCRVFNAAVKLNVPVSRITSNFDSITISFGKGLGAPIGAMVMGSTDFIHKARRVRKALGGGTSQIGFMAAAAMYALDHWEHLRDDYEHTQMIAQAIREAENPFITVPEAKDIHSNILMVSIDTSKLTPKKFIGRLSMYSPQDENPIIIKALPVGDRTVRFVLCINNSRSDVEAAIIKIKQVIDGFR